MSRIVNDLTNLKFGRLLVIKMVGANKHGHFLWECKCDCGNIKIVAGENLKSLSTVSCGCYNKEVVLKINLKHGNNRRGKTTVEYTTWSQMISRCNNVNNQRYKNYGGRGIKVCDRWLHSFENFLADMGKRPSNKHSIERDNTNGDYTPKNCRWATDIEQARNRTDNRWIEFNGKKMILQDWVRELNAYHANVSKMLKSKTFQQVYNYYMFNRRKKRSK